jgi:hypothetical protein
MTSVVQVVLESGWVGYLVILDLLRIGKLDQSVLLNVNKAL